MMNPFRKLIVRVRPRKENDYNYLHTKCVTKLADVCSFIDTENLLSAVKIS